MAQTKRQTLFLIVLRMGSFILSLLALPFVRNWIWKKLIGKSKERVVDAKAKIVRE